MTDDDQLSWWYLTNDDDSNFNMIRWQLSTIWWQTLTWSDEQLSMIWWQTLTRSADNFQRYDDKL